ncbi:hypothetical protein [Stackebrandtia nassauensis]|uniref:Uncharacterized protein n=1 Tax=Stackebrandtia nassauensis (strain DSM 44728 / CIP 108903 / NRRL B-16338 / NBRC 102104 / LLR-40K-21) TaxID=446470 RepID=D3PUQ7_STANL|nr:hypothetical protein [Stackebrandtia nassauensis]ADD44931.1 hypothetical protein Snas_5297 [Stackebrandtia nassauensis DSM 44728]
MASRLATVPPPPVLAAFVLALATGLVWMVLALWPAPGEPGGGLFFPMTGLLLAVFTAFCVWQGERRGNLLVAVLFGVIPCLALLTSPRLGILQAAMGAALIVLLTVPTVSRQWFGYGG